VARWEDTGVIGERHGDCGMPFDDLLESRDPRVYADFFLPYLDAMTHVLDLGCGDGALSIGLAASAGQVTAVDTEPETFAAAVKYCESHEVDNVVFAEGDATALSFPEPAFDACLCHSLLEAGPDPAAVLAEVWRVLRPGGYVGAASTEYDGLILAGPSVELLRRANAIREQLWIRAGADPFLGKELRRLIGEAGFDEVVATTKAFSYGTPARVREFAEGRAAECWDEEFVASAVDAGLATADEVATMARAWSAWGESPASYAAFTWCRAVGRKPLAAREG
jgi:SAM-dependent methyltransferase